MRPRYSQVFTLSVGFFLLFIVSCNENSEEVDEVFSFPMEIGNHWNYSGEHYQYVYLQDNEDKEYLDTTFVTSRETVLVNDTVRLADSLLTLEVITVGVDDFNSSLNSYYDVRYYSNTEKGLFFNAYIYKSYSETPLKKRSENGILFKGRYFNDLSEIENYYSGLSVYRVALYDSIIFHDPPFQVLKYPLEVDSSWVYSYFPPDSVWIEKSVIGEEVIELPIGIFTCFKIERRWDINHDGVWDEDIIGFEWVSDIGFVKRRIEVCGMIITSSEYPEGTGELSDGISEYFLTDYLIK